MTKTNGKKVAELDSKPMRIVELAAENVKRLHAVEIHPNGSLVVIGGRNGAGKSSVLDAIVYALAGKGALAEKPVRIGAEEADIRLEIEGEPTLIVRRNIKPDGSSTLTVTQVSGRGIESKVSSPQKLLDSLVGRLAFDPLAFVRESPQRQVEMLQQVVGCDVSDLDAEYDVVFDERTDVNRELKSLESRLAAAEFYPDAPDSEVSVKELVAEQTTVQRALNAVKDCDDAVEVGERRVAELKRQLAEAEDLLEDSKRHADKAREALSQLPRCDLNEITAEISASSQVNAKVQANRRRELLAQDTRTQTGKSQALTNKLDAIRQQRVKRLSEAKWPMPGLEFSLGGITYNGLPFRQCSSAEQLRVATAIGLAQKPDLRILFIRDGSLLDEQSLEIVAQLAAKYDAQVWVERVGKGAECSVVIEDGQVERSSEIV